MHWADVIAKDIAERAETPLIATGISPTGIIHVGSLREAITGESIRSAVESLGKPRVAEPVAIVLLALGRDMDVTS